MPRRVLEQRNNDDGIFFFHFWNLEQFSTEKAGIQPTYHEPFQEVVTSPLPAPLDAEQNFVFLCFWSAPPPLVGEV